jgi:hypothetical protein
MKIFKPMLCGIIVTTLISTTLAEEATPPAASDSPERREEEVTATLARAKAERSKITKDTPQRDVASMPKASDVAFQKEFDTLMDKDDDQAWFDQVDKLVEQ